MQGNGDYISREAVVSSLNRLCDRVCQYSKAQRNVMCGACPLGDAFMVIEDGIPAADVRPVVRAYWKSVPHKRARVCSRCEADEPYKFADDDANVYNFCPNCGADMRPPKEET